MAYYKIAWLGYNLDAVLESESYHLEAVLEFYGHGTDVDIELALPSSGPSQVVSDEAFSSEDMKFRVVSKDGNRRAEWMGESVNGRRTIAYTATVVTKNLLFKIDPSLAVHRQIAGDVGRYLLADSVVQSGSAEIAALADSLRLSADSTMLFNVTAIYEYVTNGLHYVQYSGMTDALTAYHLGEASCGGKSRLMVALARYVGIPARLVGGKILASGQSRATHIWVECYVQGYWVPFCPTNKHFAEVPSNYLILYYGEQPVVSHTKDINFKYYFNLKKRLVSNPSGLAALSRNPLDILNIWLTFKRVAISLELLKIIIMLPIGVLAVVLFRNLVGIETFGTFMPALIAVGFRETGLWRGVLLFGLLLMFGALIRHVLSRMQLLHTPRLAIILSGVVLFMLGITAAGIQLGWLELARVTLFPMVILTLTVERFALLSEEDGAKAAIRISLHTVLVAASAYLLMSWRLLQSVAISFPEMILAVIAIYIYIGRYSGFRLMEYSRFRHLFSRT
ncbi:MAG TPA: UUP1 family membrane protein [Candidatus Deferrimicrobium sp.]|nr:UUP1 family membrane protein [Candidatus Deferrimicrobium sp.]